MKWHRVHFREVEDLSYIARASLGICQKRFEAFTFSNKNVIMTHIIKLIYETARLILILISYVPFPPCHCHSNDLKCPKRIANNKTRTRARGLQVPK